jgi:hypothetical protein
MFVYMTLKLSEFLLCTTQLPFPDSFAQPAMATDPDFLMQLPDELLLNVAHHMAAPDLVNLSLVSKRLGAIAQEALHSSPQDISGGSNLVSLSTTLIRRSDLARKVTKLTLMVGREKESIPLSFSWSMTEITLLWPPCKTILKYLWKKRR